MKSFPRLASIALTARCAELLAPSLVTLWKNMPEEEWTLLRSAIRGAKEAATTGRVPDTLDSVAMDITRLVGRFELFLHGIDVEGSKLPDSVTSLGEEQIGTIRAIIDVAARGARAATAAEADQAVSECLDAISWSYTVVDDLGDSELASDLQRSIDLLQEHCERERLVDYSRISWTGSQWKTNRS
jgi:hypothetical protein